MNTTLIYAVKRANILINHPSDIRRKYYMRPYYTPKQYPNNCRYKNVRRLKDEKTGKVFTKLYHKFLLHKAMRMFIIL